MKRPPIKKIPNPSEADKIRFWSKVNKEGPLVHGMADKCWDWTAGKCNGKYGMFCISKINYYAHRVSLLISGVPQNEEKPYILHYCDRPCCVNPKHVWEGTLGENNTDRQKKGRSRPLSGALHPSKTRPEYICKGEKHGNSKFVSAEILEIRQRSALGEKVSVLAKEHKVCSTHISQIIKRKLWKHI